MQNSLTRNSNLQVVGPRDSQGYFLFADLCHSPFCITSAYITGGSLANECNHWRQTVRVGGPKSMQCKPFEDGESS